MRYFAAAFVFVLIGCVLPGRPVFAVGEAVNGFPNWSERVLLEWINRARSDPQTDLTSGSSSGCGTNCPENMASCYTAQPPRVWNADIAHSARYHSDEMSHNSYFDHWSECTVVSNIATLYLAQPQQCNGAASCACTEHAISGISQSGTAPGARMQLFGGDQSGSWGEIIAGDSQGPDNTFYLWLYEHSSTTACAESVISNSDENGHRWLILTSQFGGSSAGPGVVGSLSTVDFDNDDGTVSVKIPSGTHYPQQAASVDAWVNWHDAAGPSVHKIDVDGVCTDMTLTRGSQTNGAWHLGVSSVGTGCHRYAFAFKDSAGKSVLYPTNGSLAIGNGGATCPDWSSVAPPSCPGFDRIFANGFDP